MSDSNTYSIKLQGPWTVLRSPQESPAVPSSVRLPAGWRTIFGDASGTAVFQRRFNCPTGLTNGHRVRIVLREVTNLQQVAINDRSLAIELRADGSRAVDITHHLQPHNQLTIELSFDPCAQPQARGGIWRPVVIEIEEPAVSPP